MKLIVAVFFVCSTMAANEQLYTAITQPLYNAAAFYAMMAKEPYCLEESSQFQAFVTEVMALRAMQAVKTPLSSGQKEAFLRQARALDAKRLRVDYLMKKRLRFFLRVRFYEPFNLITSSQYAPLQHSDVYQMYRLRDDKTDGIKASDIPFNFEDQRLIERYYGMYKQKTLQAQAPCINAQTALFYWVLAYLRAHDACLKFETLRQAISYDALAQLKCPLPTYQLWHTRFQTFLTRQANHQSDCAALH